MTVLEILFWTSAVFLAWTYAGYPVAILLLGALRSRRVRREDTYPYVSVVFVPKDRDPLVERRLRALADLDYPEDRLEILVAPVNPSHDLRGFLDRVGDPRIRLVTEGAHGRRAARRDAVDTATGEILAFVDPMSLVHSKALRSLGSHFADPAIGAVAGNRVHLRSRGEDSTLGGERLYSDWDKWLKHLESRTASISGPDRALWAVRREHWVDAPPGRDGDLETAAAVVRFGQRVLWDPEALSWERGGEAAHRFDLRTRAAAARVATLAASPGILLRHGLWSFVVTSHVAARLLSPVFLMVLLVSSASLLGRGLAYELATVLQCLFYGSAALGWLARESAFGRAPWLSVPLFVCLGWGAAVAALLPPGQPRA
ncbi:MAG: glycosyltransferase [Gemmatimonadetes bacterium]|nr:glycosyltransferase [Gemmatimonadota bacterium]